MAGGLAGWQAGKHRLPGFGATLSDSDPGYFKGLAVGCIYNHRTMNRAVQRGSQPRWPVASPQPRKRTIKSFPIWKLLVVLLLAVFLIPKFLIDCIRLCSNSVVPFIYLILPVFDLLYSIFFLHSQIVFFSILFTVSFHIYLYVYIDM